MDQQNRLLAMLQSATSPSSDNHNGFHSHTPGSGPGSSTSSLSLSHNITNPNHLSVQNTGTGSPREPSPTPPPPSLQALSLHDLFRNIQSPPVPPVAVPVTSPPPPKEDHQNKLLGMLKNIGQTQPPYNGAGAVTPGIIGSGLSGVGTPEKKDDPLPPSSNTFKGPIASPQAPVINHPTVPAPPAPTQQQTPSDRNYAQEQPKKSMFDFVSPFDVFDKPKSNPPPPAPIQPPSQAQIQKSTPLRANPKPKFEQPVSRSSSADRINVVLPGSVKPTLPAPSSNQQPVQELSEADIAKAIEKIWHVSKVAKDVKGNGLEALQSHNIINLSKPNNGSLVNSPGITQITPAAKIRPESLDFRRGRRVATTANWIAYTFQQGRIRLIDTHTGALGVLQLSMNASLGPVRDVAVTPTLVAALGYDSVVSVWRVPDGWTKDNFQAESIGVFPTSSGGIGDAFKVEWAKKDKKDFLAVGGDQGVVVFDPATEGRPNESIALGKIPTANKILRTEGPIVDFCLNQTHQAIGLLSTDSQFTLYNLATLARVWNRQLPSEAAPVSPPSSVQFCESNILVGRANNTDYELVQITTDLAVLSSIKFISPSPSPEKLHYTQATYDSTRAVLWVAPFSRSSLYAFKYALKGQQPIDNVSKSDGPKVIAFDRVTEYPLDSVLSLALAKKTAEEDPELVFASPSGVSQVTISKSSLDSFKAPLARPPVTEISKQSIKNEAAEPVQKRSGKIGTPHSKPSSKVASPAAVKTEIPSSDDESSVPQVGSQSKATGRALQSANAPPTQGDGIVGVTQDELNKALKKTEDRLSNHFRQLLKNEVAPLNGRLEAIPGPESSNELWSKIEKQIKTSLPTLIQQEIKRSVVPTANTTLQNEVREMMNGQVASAITGALHSLPEKIERGLTPTVQRTLASVVNNYMERAIQDSIQHILVPAMSAASSKLGDQLVSELRSEMLQIRKELSPPRVEGQLSNEVLLKTMASSISDLQKQIKTLSEQVRTQSHSNQSQAPHPQSNINNGPSAMAQAPAPAPVPVPAPQTVAPTPLPHGLTPSQLEDTFLHALSANSTPAILQLVSEYWGLTESILPSQPGLKSPLSQAVLLTLLHRLAIALNEVTPGNPLFAQITGWERRTLILLDPKDENIKTYISRVLQVVRDLLNTILHNLSTRFNGDLNSPGHIGVLRGVLDIVAHKQSQVV